MTNKKIAQIADFLYSSESSDRVPFRISVTFGMGGYDLDKGQFIRLMKLLRDAEPNKESYRSFLNELD